ncbi:uncharacterized protein LOC135848633 [Planococcus citri]|uniref:uncharacterized protein LOC135848633 n=1 Tax=Planococcus citri TaxID=170843 RepID=UPI0031F9D83C
MKMKYLLILLMYFVLSLVPSPHYVESTPNELTTSTQSPGLFGYFGNLWKKSWSNNEILNSTQTSTRTRVSVGHTRVHRAIESSTTESAGLFNHVKNWMGVIREKIPLNMQKRTSKGTISVESNSSTSTNFTHSFEFNNISSIVADHPASSTVNSTTDIARSTDTNTESTSKILDNFPQQSLKKSGESEWSDMSFAPTSKERNTQSEEQNTLSEDFVYPEKVNRYNTWKLESSSSNELTESTTTQTSEFTEGPVTKNRLSNVNKLTPAYFSFYNAEDLVSNGMEKEDEPLPTVPSRIYSSRTRKRKSSKISKRKTMSESSNDSDSSDSD